MQIHEINIDVRDREIEVSLSDDDQIHIMYYENSKEYYDISVFDDAVLSMTSESNKEWTDFIGGKPAAENRKIRTSNGGDIAFESLHIGSDLTLDVKNGDISGTLENNFKSACIVYLLLYNEYK